MWRTRRERDRQTKWARNTVTRQGKREAEWQTDREIERNQPANGQIKRV